MLHQQHRRARPGQLDEQGAEGVGLGVVEPGGRLVQEQQPGPGGEGAGDLDQAGPPGGQGVGPLAGHRAEAHPVDHGVDASLRALLEDAFGDEKVAIAFEAPTPEWVAEQRDQVLDLFLYDVRPVLEGRVGEAEDVRDERGLVIGRQPPPRTYRLSYLVSAWAARPEQEHRILGRVLDAVPDHDALPAAFLEGRLGEQGLPVSLDLGADHAGPGHPAIWGALGTAARTALDLRVVASVVPPLQTALAAPAVRLDLGLSREDGGVAPPPPGPRAGNRWGGVERTERGPR